MTRDANCEERGDIGSCTASGTDASRVVKSKLRAEAFRESEENWDETNIGGETNDHR